MDRPEGSSATAPCPSPPEVIDRRCACIEPSRNSFWRCGVCRGGGGGGERRHRVGLASKVPAIAQSGRTRRSRTATPPVGARGTSPFTVPVSEDTTSSGMPRGHHLRPLAWWRFELRPGGPPLPLWLRVARTPRSSGGHSRSRWNQPSRSTAASPTRGTAPAWRSYRSTWVRRQVVRLHGHCDYGILRGSKWIRARRPGRVRFPADLRYATRKGHRRVRATGPYVVEVGVGLVIPHRPIDVA